MTPVVRAETLTKRFGEFTAVDGIGFTVFGGECFGFLGPNGAGKTTTMRMITSHLPVTSGTLEVLGMDVGKEARKVKARIGVAPQEDNLDPDLTVMDNLLVFGRYHSLPPSRTREKARDLLSFMQLEEHEASPIARLSGGMKRRLLIARSLLNDPDLLILDEPTSGLDPQARHMIWQKLRSLLARGVTMVLTTHYMEEAERLCTRLVIMDKARVVAEGTPGDLIGRHAGEEVVEVRLREGEDREACLREIADSGVPGLEVETAGDTLYLYTRGGASLLARLKVRPDRTVLHRRASLEDVFLRLTGRDLKE